MVQITGTVDFTCPNCDERQPLGEALEGGCRDCGFDVALFHSPRAAQAAYDRLSAQKGNLVRQPVELPSAGRWLLSHTEMLLA